MWKWTKRDWMELLRPALELLAAGILVGGIAFLVMVALGYITWHIVFGG